MTVFHITHDNSRRIAAQAVMLAPEGWQVQVHAPKRSVAQNALMWSLLEQIAKSVVWHGAKLTKENWKDVLTSSLKRQTVVPGIDGGFVVCGTSTSAMTIPEMNEVCEMAFAFGAQQGVAFREQPAMEAA